MKDHLRKVGPAILVLGGVLLFWQLGPRWPHDLRLALRVSHPETVRAVRVTWLLEGEPVHGSSLAFSAGAPAEIDAPIRLQRGRYEVDFEVDRVLESPGGSSGGEPVRARRRIDVGDAERITISLP